MRPTTACLMSMSSAVAINNKRSFLPKSEKSKHFAEKGSQMQGENTLCNLIKQPKVWRNLWLARSAEPHAYTGCTMVWFIDDVVATGVVRVCYRGWRLSHTATMCSSLSDSPRHCRLGRRDLAEDIPFVSLWSGSLGPGAPSFTVTRILYHSQVESVPRIYTLGWPIPRHPLVI